MTLKIKTKLGLYASILFNSDVKTNEEKWAQLDSLLEYIGEYPPDTKVGILYLRLLKQSSEKD